MREWKRILLCAGLAMGFGCDTDDDSAADLGLEGPSGPGAGMEIPGESGEQQAVAEPETEGPAFTGGSWALGECGESLFLPVSEYSGPGEAYPAPELAVSCTEETRVVTSNGIPHYTYQSTTPNGLEAQNFQWEVPLNPVVADSTTDLPCLGTVGYSINGIPIYGPNEGPFPDPYGDPVANGVMDWCQGHTGGDADYHYHALIESCLQVEEGSTDPSPVLGFALDGFPIYGPRGCLDEACDTVVTFQSAWEPVEGFRDSCTSDVDCAEGAVCADAVVDGAIIQACVSADYAWDTHVLGETTGETTLDACNGRIGPDGTYRYHATSTFPYILGCFRGTATNAGGPMGGGQCPSAN